MPTEKFTNNSYTVGAILGLIEANSIAIPEIQRPFVWKSTQVRDLMDSLYKGYPTGYIILWNSPNVKMKDGRIAGGKRIIIDGQQRITAMTTALAGRTIFNSDFVACRYKIAFDPFAALDDNPEAEIFAVQTPAHLKSKRFIPDIAEVMSSSFSSFKFIHQYVEDNPGMDADNLSRILEKLRNIRNTQLGVIELSSDLDIGIVTDIFIRINSKGTALSQGDFVMSKMAADEDHNGNTLRKLIDYFAHLSVVPSYYNYIAEHDKDFAETPYLQKLSWLQHEVENVYDPGCDDVIRVAFMHKFKRAKLANLVQMMSGRDFVTREFREEIVENTFAGMYEGVLNVINEHNFKQFMIAMRSAGFISPKLVNSQMALNFAYALYLMLRESGEVPVADVKRLVQKWYVLSVLTGRYASSPESSFAKDINRIGEIGIVNALGEIEAVIGNEFWTVQLKQNLQMTSTINPTYQVYLAAQVYFNDMSLLSNNVSVKTLIEQMGDVHHVFPKAYLIKNGKTKAEYNQNANYAYLDRPVNESIGMMAPCEYFTKALDQCGTGIAICGSILNKEELLRNLEANCIPDNVFSLNSDSYDSFLDVRRAMMVQKIRKYYESL